MILYWHNTALVEGHVDESYMHVLTRFGCSVTRYTIKINQAGWILQSRGSAKRIKKVVSTGTFQNKTNEFQAALIVESWLPYRGSMSRWNVAEEKLPKATVKCCVSSWPYIILIVFAWYHYRIIYHTRCSSCMVVVLLRVCVFGCNFFYSCYCWYSSGGYSFGQWKQA